MECNQTTGDVSPVINRFMFRQVENLLYEHPAVDEVAVIYAPGQDGKECLVAFIVPRADNVTETEILAFMQQSNQLAAENLPRLVKFIPRIPKSPSGKVLKMKLLEEAEIAT
ncbi:AMP-binding enzyme [Desulfallas thermosapovorans]|uniref:Fatty-acyl-CoA synthase/long-chain acyl-CoA synthetase n=1 Tax=Desulfallas thermosapovorans DSM 6562 TaxID=1121431 RepID=A0A5S5A0G4_9FIRM|nr:class I adenylate-forming enzyme family protein [Desulfallas thermosapovorans]TYO97980.1 fatty-acyl-CoA synthase/long-chain acyl-CoA synthetase [Desulfallas thermosapovorans DSM 6562]